MRKAKEALDLYDDCHYFRIESVSPKRGTGTVNTTRIYDVDGTNVNDLVKAQILARKQERSLIRFMRKYIPGCESCYIATSAQCMGVRETRRIIGEYAISEEDILAHRNYLDTIAIGYSIENPGVEGHSPDGGEGSEHDIAHRKAIAQIIRYEIPYRCLIPKRIEGLLVSGRCISATHTGSKYIRSMSSCMYTGQAAGTAAASSPLPQESPSERWI